MKKLILVFCVIMYIGSATAQKRIIVSQDGDGDFTTIQQAINSLPDYSGIQEEIFVKKGTYKERVVVPATKTNLLLRGEDVKTTIITYDNYASKLDSSDKAYGTSGSGSFYVYGTGFSATNVTFENSSGPVGQALAIYVEGDKASFFNCHFLGFQDTIYTHGPGRQYYKNCYIEGTTDFIFGAATAFFEQCDIFCKKGGSYLSAASTPDTAKYGYVFFHCHVTGSAAKNSFALGRPWRPYAKVVYLYCDLSDVILAKGWDNWRNPENEKTAYYAEYKNTGAGAQPEQRVTWSHQLTDEEAKLYTTNLVLSGWEPGIPGLDRNKNIADTTKDAIAENMLIYQRAIGGWPKAVKEIRVDYIKPLSNAQKAAIKADSLHADATIDNDATFKEITYLIKSYHKTNNKAYLKAAEKGIRYLLKAQDDNGGWPQYFPDASLYRSAITFNDQAMINTMTILNHVAQRNNGFESVDPTLIHPAELAVKKGIDCILKTQIIVDGKLTAWNQQYDKNTLKPVMARKFELIGLACSESAGIVEFLMQVKHPSAAIKKSIKEAVAWFDLVKIKGYNFKHIQGANQPKGKDMVIVADPDATIWARYYEIGTNKPFFSGRDSVKKYNLTEIENERRAGYAWYGTWPQKILDKGYPEWLRNNE